MPDAKALVLEPMRRTSGDARRLALRAHRGQLDKAGFPYSTHLERVCERAVGLYWDSTLGGGPGLRDRLEEVRQIAWLHDVIEDKKATGEDLEQEGFSETVVDGVGWLTRPDGMSYRAYIEEMAECAPLAVLLVKIADVEDNSDPARLALLPAETRARLEKKYGAALPVLKAAAERLGWREERS